MAKIFRIWCKAAGWRKRGSFIEVGYEFVFSEVGTRIAIKVDDMVGWEVLEIRQLSAGL